MSNRAKEAALKAYPRPLFGPQNITEDDCNRQVFIRGYEQAEKDLALTVDDIEGIHIFLYAIKNNKTGAFTFHRLSKEQYEEVLRRFLESKNKAK